MFVLAVITFIAALILFAAKRRTGLRVVGFLAIGALILSGVCLSAASLVMVPAGHVGVPVLFGDVSTTVFASGLHVKNPLADVVKVSVQERAYTMGISGEVASDKERDLETITALTNEGMKVDLNITVQYRINADKVPWILNTKVWTNIDQFEAAYVRPEVRRAIRDVCSKYSGQQLYSEKRGAVGEEIREYADRLMAKNGVTCVALNLRNVALPASVTMAIERKKEREQQSQEYDYKLEVERKEADRKRIEAEGIRDFQLTVSQGISPLLIQWKGIEAAEKLAASSNAKVIIFGDSKIPVILGGQ